MRSREGLGSNMNRVRAFLKVIWRGILPVKLGAASGNRDAAPGWVTQ